MNLTAAHWTQEYLAAVESSFCEVEKSIGSKSDEGTFVMKAPVEARDSMPEQWAGSSHILSSQNSGLVVHISYRVLLPTNKFPLNRQKKIIMSKKRTQVFVQSK